MTEDEKLRARVHNLEVALVQMWALTQHLLPQGEQHATRTMLDEFLTASQPLGAAAGPFGSRPAIFVGDA